MIVTVASGKGGTGKTTVTVNLAATAPATHIQVFDCDVEEPNSHIFLKPETISSSEITTMVPKVDKEKCTLCGECEKICQFSAITLIAGKIMTFPEMCHSCRGCAMVCPEGAIGEDSRVLGKLLSGTNKQGIDMIWGELRVGEAMAPPLIKQVKQKIDKRKLALVDAPPGTSCPAIETLRDSDFALLVSEPTPFGLNDLALTVEGLKQLNVPMGIVINRADAEKGILDEYASRENIEIMQRFPFSREAAMVCSKGLLLVDEMPEMKVLFQELYKRIAVKLESLRNGIELTYPNSPSPDMERGLGGRGKSGKWGGNVMKELTVISGKGGTGKTTVTASLASLAESRIVIDADVDAANLFLTLQHEVLEKESFEGGHKAWIDENLCTQCGDCRERCQFDAISEDFVIDSVSCEGCGVCVHFCPADAITFERQICGEKFISTTPNGPMIHARLGIAEENSGLLVSQLRQRAREMAKEKKIPLIITDGPPGIGCPVIASVSNADAVLIVTEPTLSGMHDMARVKQLADQMNAAVYLCVNKSDLNQEATDNIKKSCAENNIRFAGEIPFDRDVIESMKMGQSLVSFSQGPAAQAVKQIWNNVLKFMDQTMDRIV